MAIWRNDGFRGLYRGLGPTIFGYLPTWAIYFTVYDKVKASMGAIKGRSRCWGREKRDEMTQFP